MDPKVLMELSTLVQQLPPDQLNRMQTLMHNMMAGYDVSKDMAEFERNLPPGFREKVASLMAGQMGPELQSMASGMGMNFGGGMGMGATTGPSAPPIEVSISPMGGQAAAGAASGAAEMNLREARITILRGVAEGHVSPDDALGLLFPQG